MIRCLIIDDEPLARQLLVSHVKQVKTLELMGVCETAIEAFELLHQHSIDLLFLDIQMPGINGLNFLRSLKQPPKVIFTTAYMEHAVEAFELEAIDYLLKPITLERFMKAVQKLYPGKESSSASTSAIKDDAIFIKVNKRLTRVEMKDIQYVEGFGDYIKIISDAGTLLSYMSLNRMEELLAPEQFLRIHKSFIINLSRVKFIENNCVRLADKEIPVGLTYKENLFRRINQE